MLKKFRLDVKISKKLKKSEKKSFFRPTKNYQAKNMFYLKSKPLKKSNFSKKEKVLS